MSLSPGMQLLVRMVDRFLLSGEYLNTQDGVDKTDPAR